MKPSYQSCKDCMRLPQGRRCDRPAGGRSHRLNPSRHCSVPSICIDPPGTHFPSTPMFHSLSTPAVNLVQPCTTCTLGDASAPQNNHQKLFSPMNCEESPPDDGSAQTEDMDEPRGVASSTEAVGVPGGEGLSFGAGEQTLAQLQMPRLGIRFGVELKLPSLAMEGQLPVGPLP